MARQKARAASNGETKADESSAAGAKPSKLRTVCLRGCAVALLLLVVAVGCSSMLLLPAETHQVEPVDSPRGPPDAAFAQAAIPLVRQFIKSRYKDYGQGKVTLRHLKQHIVAKTDLGLTYEDTFWGLGFRVCWG
ncbi:unnamed protein product [Symbiodinium pilosum]|uniref:Uncharacterized protein n=1 Tax=Symbiodinium pilosum TaxID=2952 RepID=A0A812LFX9_SYMPI|nr:unnamed protein product [Symbiodinium pilosum]